MLTELCQYLRNWFNKGQPKLYGTFHIENGKLTPKPDELQEGQYYRIIGSVFNDGVHKRASSESMDAEDFDGCIWLMAVPPEIIALAQEIELWIAANKDAINSPYMSESFGGYSYSKGASSIQASGGASTEWETHFGSRLAPWRKI